MTALRRVLAHTLVAAGAGLAVFATYQPTGMWWAGVPGVALLMWVVLHSRSVRGVVWLTWVQGLVTYLLLLPWIGEFVGASAWIALAVVESLYSAVLGLGLAALVPWWRSGRRRGPVVVVTAAWFVAVEWFRSTWPFGGFPWGRMAWGQVGGPIAPWVSVAGPALVTFMLVVAGLGLLTLVERRWVAGGVPVVVALGGGLLLGAVAVPGVNSTGTGDSGGDDATPRTVNVAAIQGNVPQLGLDFAQQRRAVLDNHVRRTRELADRVRAGEAPQPDIVIWPENSSDVSPFSDPTAAALIDGAAADVGAPILVGTLSRDDVGPKNTMVVWNPDGTGPADTHSKRYLQPFGEYMPFRDLLRKVSPYVDRAGNFTPGDDDGVVGMAGVDVGVATCYEVAFDGAFRDAVTAGAQLLAVPTNNATFGFTDMTYQQLAMSRMRAVEYDRAVVVAATSGVSAIVEPDGTVAQRSEIFRGAVLQADLPLPDPGAPGGTVTLSARVGPGVEYALAALGLGAVVVAGAAGVSSRRASARTGRPRRTARPARTGSRPARARRTAGARNND
ncbi:apolipoprotein N-acyltransferase [Corynebacterium bovis]|uniref:apolipoprotein N-acyltransferase n=1 Tax=Corynebacterium bovis TaxID=36808 RepID=UPI002447F3BD|nr:apolipoprotein N-acyltransferase [Corynebacterium bovis]MDH2454935.1 apolipoprotein N-acyltransferase [Corynebacterium bovis]